jgi:hypothetical protein
MEIVILVLIGNPMVIGKLISSDEGYTIEKPVNLHLIQTHDKIQPTMSNIVEMLSDAKTIHIPRSAVSYVIDKVMDKLQNSYTQFVSNIAIPTLIKG